MAPTNFGKSVAGLRKLMAEHKLTQRDVAELACVSVKTVESWLAEPGAGHFRQMPARHLLAIAHQLPGFLGKRKTAARAARKEKK